MHYFLCKTWRSLHIHDLLYHQVEPQSTFVYALYQVANYNENITTNEDVFLSFNKYNDEYMHETCDNERCY